MYRHLLVPLDGSELTTNLVTQAVDFARSIGARARLPVLVATVERNGAEREADERHRAER